MLHTKITNKPRRLLPASTSFALAAVDSRISAMRNNVNDVALAGLGALNSVADDCLN